jgi:hypothetical protein
MNDKVYQIEDAGHLIRFANKLRDINNGNLVSAKFELDEVEYKLTLQDNGGFYYDFVKDLRKERRAKEWKKLF